MSNRGRATDWRAGFITETFRPAHTPETIRFQVHAGDIRLSNAAGEFQKTGWSSCG